MRAVLSKTVAIALVVLGVSPFTAPFSIVELTPVAASGLSSDHGARHDQPSNDHGRHGALIRTAANRLLPLALARTAMAAVPDSARPSTLPLADAASPSVRRAPIQALRI
jgi:hypothetical protein